MKTTVELPDELLREVKETARAAHITMRELLIDSLRSELDRRRQAGSQVDFVFPAAGGDGMLPGVDPTGLLDYAYDDVAGPR